MRRRLLIATPLALAGCTSVLPAQKYVATTDWPLDPPPPDLNAAADPGGRILLVRALSAGPGMDDTALRVLQPDGSLQERFYDRWAVPPVAAATAALTAWLTASGAFGAVVEPGTRLTADLTLEGELTELLSDASAGQARAVLTLVVIRDGGSLTAAAVPITQKRITGTAALAGMDVPAQVAAQRAALADALAQAVRLVTRYA